MPRSSPNVRVIVSEQNVKGNRISTLILMVQLYYLSVFVLISGGIEDKCWVAALAG